VLWASGLNIALNLLFNGDDFVLDLAAERLGKMGSDLQVYQ
jgi:hypothetical protein